MIDKQLDDLKSMREASRILPPRRPKTNTKPKTKLDRELDQLTSDGYTPINPDHNAINLILADLGKADLSPREVEELCQTAKVVGLNGFTRIDLLPCGCSRIYKGMLLGFDQNPKTYTLRVGGIEGVRSCPKHIELIGGIKYDKSSATSQKV